MPCMYVVYDKVVYGCDWQYEDLSAYDQTTVLQRRLHSMDSTSNSARRPDTKKKLVVVGDGTQDSHFLK